jgi:hypothetical protein
MPPKRVNYGKFALQAFLIFAAAHAVHLWDRENPSADWPAFAISVLKWGILGAAIVTGMAVIRFKIVETRANKQNSRKFLIAGLILFALAFAWFIPMLDQAGRWFPDPDIANQVILWPFLILIMFGAAFVGWPLSAWFGQSMGRRTSDEP